MTRSSGKPKIGWLDHLFGLALCVAYVFVLLNTADFAMSRDESFYVAAAERYGTWLDLAAKDFGKAAEQSSIDRHWNYNHEHPALAKTAFALSHLANEAWHLFPRPSMAHRFPGMVMAGLLLWLVYLFGARAYGRWAGFYAALALGLLPRLFYHAHLNCFDVPIVLMVTWTTYCYWRSLTRKRWAFWVGVSFGCALATKHNAWIVPGVFLIHWLWTVWREAYARKKDEGRAVSLLPWWLPSMAILGPAVFIGSWPWLWNDTLPRFEEYAAFHLKHVHYSITYFGETLNAPPFPIAFPWVMTAYTVPATTVVLALAGILLQRRSFVPPGLETRVRQMGSWVAQRLGILTDQDDPRVDRSCTDVLLLGSILAPLVAISLPSSPIFGGTKHWLTAYPFMVLFAGAAFAQVVRMVGSYLGEGRGRLRSVAGAAVAVVLLAPAVAETAHSQRFGLSHYGFFAGGVPGAADDGMNRQFWGFTPSGLFDWFKERMPNGGTVWICDATHQSWNMSQRDGALPKNIRATWNMAAADYIIIHHEHHFAEVEYQAWVAFGSPAVARVLTYDGVPIVTVYENPRRRNRH